MPTPAPLAHRFPVRVYYEDTDAAGVVYYANYLKFCERARTEYLRSTGIEQQALRAARNLVFVVRAVNAEYLKGAELDDALVVETGISEMGRAKLVFYQRLMRGEQCLFEADFVVVCVDWNKKKPASIPDDIRAAFAAA